MMSNSTQVNGSYQNYLDFIMKSEGTISKQNLIQVLLFYFLLINIDLVLLLHNQISFQFMLPKLLINAIFMALSFIFSKKIKLLQTNVMLFISKAISILLIFLIGQEYLIIIILLLYENYYIQEPFINFALKILIKLGCLASMIFPFGMIEVITISSIIILDISKQILALQQKNFDFVLSENYSLQNKQTRETISAQVKESHWIGRIQQIPICYIILSKKEQRIKFKNEITVHNFSIICKSDEDYNEFILKKMNFIILGDQSLESQNINIDVNFRKNKSRKNFNKCEIDDNDLCSQNSINSSQNKQTIEKILEQQIEDNDLKSQIIQLYGQYTFEDLQTNKIHHKITFVGQIMINQNDDDVIITLQDVSKQFKFQEQQANDEFKTQIVKSFSHELRTPLNSSCNFLQFCLNEKSINDDIKLNFITPAINALRLQSYLINDIIDFSSICADNMELDITNVTVEQIVDEVNKLFKSLLEMKNLILYIDLTENQLKMIGTDFQRLIQILVNLLQNSIKYSNSGVIYLKLTSFSKNYLKISIKDEGFGIEEERLLQLQQMLQKIEEKRNLNDFSQWHGFGLLISQMLLTKLRPIDYKSLLIRSEGLQKGTKVTFYIQNHKLSHESSSLKYKENNKIFQSKKRISLQSGSNHHISINGTILQISDLFVSNRKVKLNPQLSKKLTSKSVKSSEYSESDSFINMDVDHNVGGLYNLQPFLFTDFGQQYKKVNKIDLSPKITRQQNKVLSYQKLKMQEDQESDKQLRKLLNKIGCNCKKILSVDDEIFNQKSIQYLLQQYGFEVILAFNGEEAIKIVLETTKCSSNCCLFIIILMDYQMPIMNGLKATMNLNQMMENNQIPQIPIVGLTAFNSKNDIDQCFQAGMSAVLTKPLIMVELFEILKQI